MILCISNSIPFECDCFSARNINLQSVLSAALEIQTVARDGVVRFYSPATNYFLAMDDRGRLYGTVSSLCNFNTFFTLYQGYFDLIRFNSLVRLIPSFISGNLCLGYCYFNKKPNPTIVFGEGVI